MNRRFFILLTAMIVFSVSVYAQRVTSCGFKIPPRLMKTNFQSVYEARDILKTMLDTIQWRENFSIREQNGIQNAYATIISGRRWIIYDNNFLEDLDAYASTKWASISVLAHEMGHHYYNHVVSSTGSTPPKEIEADAFSGFVMAKLGASLEQSVAAMQSIASDRASTTHPAKRDRISSITNGWNKGKSNTTGSGQANPGNTNPGNTNPGSQTTSQKDPGWIALFIQSNKDETVYLSDDGKNFQPAEIKAGQPFVFKFEIYNYGWLRLKYYNNYRIFKLQHGKDYNILWNRRKGNWTVVEVPE
jgi:hypothetical protein